MRKSANTLKKLEEKQREQRQNEQLRKMKLIEIVQNNERSESQGAGATESDIVIFGHNSEFEIPSEERKLLDYTLLTKITDFVYNSESFQEQGFAHCISLYSSYIFVGFSNGLIRVFDIRTNEELKGLFPKKKKQFSSRVNCMDVSLSGERLVAGYACGKICVFDIFKSKVIIEIDDVYKTEVEYVYFLSNLSANHLIAADKRGFIQKIVISKKLLSYSSKSEKIIENPIEDICSISALQPKEGMPYEVIEWAGLNLTALSSTEQIMIYTLDNNKILYNIYISDFGHDFIRPKSL